VTFENAGELWKKLYGDIIGQNKTGPKPRFEKGANVRMSRNKHIFEKGYIPSWSDEILEVEGIKQTDPVRYRVKDERGEPFHGTFYEPDLSRAYLNPSETTYRIEKIYRTRVREGKKQHNVKFFDDPNRYWIDESDFAD
jgi:phosphoenolpyruvate synthase/pyruvate phosphate dikinase